MACTVVISPSTIPKLSFRTLAKGARQLVVQEALETTSVPAIRRERGREGGREGGGVRKLKLVMNIFDFDSEVDSRGREGGREEGRKGGREIGREG